MDNTYKTQNNKLEDDFNTKEIPDSDLKYRRSNNSSLNKNLEQEKILESNVKLQKEGNLKKGYYWYTERNNAKKEKLKSLTKAQKVKYYTRDLFINSTLAFVYDFILRILFSWLFFDGKMPSSIPGYFFDFLFVKYGVYYTVIWIISAIAFFNYLGKEKQNIKIFYYAWFSLVIICVSQILIDFHTYANFLNLVLRFEFKKIFNLFMYNSFQVELFVLFWSVQNIVRFIYVSKNMAKIKIDISEIED